MLANYKLYQNNWDRGFEVFLKQLPFAITKLDALEITRTCGTDIRQHASNVKCIWCFMCESQAIRLIKKKKKKKKSKNKNKQTKNKAKQTKKQNKIKQNKTKQKQTKKTLLLFVFDQLKKI